MGLLPFFFSFHHVLVAERPPGWINIFFTKALKNRGPKPRSRYREIPKYTQGYCQSQQQDSTHLSSDSNPAMALLIPALLMSQTHKMRIESLCQWPNNWMSTTRAPTLYIYLVTPDFWMLLLVHCWHELWAMDYHVVISWGERSIPWQILKCKKKKDIYGNF